MSLKHFGVIVLSPFFFHLDVLLRKVNREVFRIFYTFNNLFNPGDVVGYSCIDTVFSFFSTALSPAYNPQKKPGVVVGHCKGATAVPFAGISSVCVVPCTEHIVGDEPVGGALTGVHVHDGQLDPHEEAQGGTSLVGGSPPTHCPHVSLLGQQGGEAGAGQADGNHVLVKNNIAAQVQQGNVTIVVVGIIMWMCPALCHSDLLFLEFSLVFVKVSWNHKELKCSGKGKEPGQCHHGVSLCASLCVYICVHLPVCVHVCASV